jgi:hypothetical protein
MTPAGVWIKDVEAVARSRWKQGKPEPEDAAEVRAFLAGIDGDRCEGAGLAAQDLTPPRVRPAARSYVLSVMSKGTPQTAAIESAVRDGYCTEGERALLLGEDLAARLQVSAPAAPAEPLRLVQPGTSGH